MNGNVLDGMLLHYSEAMVQSDGDTMLPIEDTTFAEQDAFVKDTSTFLAAETTRRAGKSSGLALKFFRAGMKHRNVMLPYIALTRESAKNIMWPILTETIRRYNIPADPVESALEIKLPTGSVIKLFGADMKNFIQRLRGIKTPFGAIDESQSMRVHIEELVDDILTPAISDFPDGQLALTGTPGPVPKGYFYDVCRGRGGFSVHRWTVYQNPYMPNIREFVARLMRDKGWDRSNPTYRREWLGEWCADPDALVFKYDAARDHFDSLPDVSYRFVIGVDLGYDDADAIAVIAYSEKLKEAYLVEEDIRTKQGITELSDTIGRLVQRYSPERVVVDAGGLGKKIAEELRRRYALPITAAEKQRKFEYIEILNDALRTRRFKAKRDSRFAQDCSLIEWDYEKSTPDRLVVSNAFHSDIADAVLYAFRESLHWLYEPEIPRPAPGTPEWLAKQEREMENAAIERAIPRDDAHWPEPVGWDE